MEFQLPYYQNFTENLQEIANQYGLDADKLKVEFYTPNCQAILVEQVENQDFKIHINLEENRIISIQRLSKGGNGYSEHLKEKYRPFMK